MAVPACFGTWRVTSLRIPQRARFVTIGVRVSQTGLAHRLDQHALAREQLHQPGDVGLQQCVQFVVGGRIDLDEARHAIVAAPAHAVQQLA